MVSSVAGLILSHIWLVTVEQQHKVHSYGTFPRRRRVSARGGGGGGAAGAAGAAGAGAEQGEEFLEQVW